jgi:cytoskeleton protein RodZ
MEVNQVESTEREETTRLGPFLRDEREKMNLSQDEIAERLRLRRFIVEAIENEKWDRLPPPVFVKGFLRSYASALDLDEKRVLDLYLRSAPPEPESLKSVAVPRASDRIRVILFLLGLAALACGAYFWYVKASTKDGENLSAVERTVPVQTEIGRPDKMESMIEGTRSATLPETTTPAALEQRPEARPIPESDSPPAQDRETPWLTLEGFVKQRTWMSIRVDGSGAKEFIFQPGERPRWKAEGGFQIVVGNAAGIDFELDGKRIENLGHPGQVVRLSLPEGFEPRAREE